MFLVWWTCINILNINYYVPWTGPIFLSILQHFLRSLFFCVHLAWRIWFYNTSTLFAWLISVWACDVKESRVKLLNEVESILIMTHDLLVLAAVLISLLNYLHVFSVACTHLLSQASLMCLFPWVHSVAIPPPTSPSFPPSIQPSIHLSIMSLCSHFGSCSVTFCAPGAYALLANKPSIELSYLRRLCL